MKKQSLEFKFRLSVALIISGLFIYDLITIFNLEKIATSNIFLLVMLGLTTSMMIYEAILSYKKEKLKK